MINPVILQQLVDVAIFLSLMLAVLVLFYGFGSCMVHVVVVWKRWRRRRYLRKRGW